MTLNYTAVSYPDVWNVPRLLYCNCPVVTYPSVPCFSEICFDRGTSTLSGNWSTVNVDIHTLFKSESREHYNPSCSVSKNPCQIQVVDRMFVCSLEDNSRVTRATHSPKTSQINSSNPFWISLFFASSSDLERLWAYSRFFGFAAVQQVTATYFANDFLSISPFPASLRSVVQVSADKEWKGVEN